MHGETGAVTVVNDACAVDSVLEGVVKQKLRPQKQKQSAQVEALNLSSYEDKVSAPPGGTEKQFKFDGAFPPDTNQKEVFQTVGLPVLVDTMKGFNGTILAYGQTGSGKTHSLLNADNDTELVGLLPRLVATLYVHSRMDRKHKYTMEAAAFQVYNEQVDDLLAADHKLGSGHNLTVSQGEVHGLTWQPCATPPDMMKAFQQARSGLHYAETKMNKASSRSHAIFQIKITRRRRANQADISSSAQDKGKKGSKVKVVCGRLSVVDLAGSERVKKSGVTGSSFKEATNINRSLLELGNVIQALASKSAHVPFRNSKLTRILEGSVGGNCKTALLVCISPAQRNYSETISTLEFASRAMNVQVDAKVNEHMMEIDPEKLAADLNQEDDVMVMDEEMLKTYKESEQALARARERTQQQEQQVAELSQQIGQIQADFSEAKKSAQASLKEKQVAEAKTAEVIKELETAQQRHAEEKRKLEEDHKQLEIKIGRTEKQLEQTTSKYESAQVEIKSQRTKLASLSKRLLEVEQSSMEKEKLAAKRISDLKTSKEAETTRLHTEMTALGEEKTKLQRQLSALKTDILAKESAQEELKTTIDTMRQSNDKMQVELEEAKQRYDHQAASAALQIDALKADIQAKAQLCEQEQEAVAIGRQAMADAQQHAARLEHRLSELGSASEGKDGVILKLQSEVSALQESINQEHMELEKSEKVAHDLEEKTHELESSISSLQAEKARILAEHQKALALKEEAQAEELARANKHAAEAVHALEVRAETDLNKLRLKLEEAKQERVQAEAKGAAAVEEARSEAIALVERLEHEKALLVKDKARQKMEYKLEKRRLSTSYQAAGKAIEAQLRQKDEALAALQSRFDARESRREDSRLIAQQKRQLRQADRRTELLKKELARKDLELENLKSTVRIFGTKNEASARTGHMHIQQRKTQQHVQTRPYTASRDRDRDRDRDFRSGNQEVVGDPGRRAKGPRPLPTPSPSR